MAYVADLYGASLYEPEVDLLGRKRRKRKRSLKGLKRKLKKKGVLRKLKARLKKKGVLRKLRAKLKSRKGRRKLKRGIKMLTTGPFGLIARRIKKRRAAKRRAALRRAGAAAIAPDVEAEDMIQQADVDNADMLEPEEVNTMAPELSLRDTAARAAKVLRMTQAEPDDEDAEDMEPEDMEPEDETAEGEVAGTSAGGIMSMVKRNPLLVAIPAGAVLLLMFSGKRRGAGA